MKVEIKDAAFGYKKFNLFEHLNVVVPAQSVLTILGPNGVGKTTLLRCMMRLKYLKIPTDY
ncbi:iron-dicitrate transporter ATP-binding subunit [Chlamydia trachomatis]|nr:iron-dicitrate transporter ATP-binding subunit [Chlamydia trachomatis]